MKSYHIEKPGDIDNLTLDECEIPEPGPYEVLVRIRATSLNRRDLMILKGTYPVPTKPGVIPISDGAGEVVAIGQGVSRVAVGDRVSGTYFVRWQDGRLTVELASEQYGCSRDGMLTEYALLKEESVVHIPDHLSWEEAATLPCAALTAWSALTGARPVMAGETVLIVGSGGVALFALQFAKLFGAQTIVITSSEAKAEKLRRLGADKVFDHTRPDWDRAVLDVTNGRGAEHIIEAVGPDTLAKSIKAAGFDSLITNMGVFASDQAGFDPKALAGRVLTIRRVAVGSRAAFMAMNRAIDLHKLHPVIERTYAFDEAREAYQQFTVGRTFGKIVIAGAE